MANAPIALTLFPDREDRKRIIAAVCTSAGGAGAVVGLTIPNGYPPIDRTISCPVLAILGLVSGAVLAINDNLIWAMAGTMALAPDSVGEFLVTGARTINVWELTARAKAVLIIYVSKGTGQET
jgi:hypothetical protein